MGGGHHIFGRARVDTAEAIIGLCAEHHWKVENAKITMEEIVTLQESTIKVALREKYKEFYHAGTKTKVRSD